MTYLPADGDVFESKDDCCWILSDFLYCYNRWTLQNIMRGERRKKRRRVDASRRRKGAYAECEAGQATERTNVVWRPVSFNVGLLSQHMAPTIFRGRQRCNAPDSAVAQPQGSLCKYMHAE